MVRTRCCIGGRQTKTMCDEGDSATYDCGPEVVCAGADRAYGAELGAVTANPESGGVSR